MATQAASPTRIWSSTTKRARFTAAGTPACSRPTSATCARRSTPAARHSSTPFAGSATCSADREAEVSLRARLMLGLLALAAVGLLIVDAVSYAELRSYLLDRTDKQVESALPIVGQRLGGTEFFQR